jgi:hypothetical protein
MIFTKNGRIFTKNGRVFSKETLGLKSVMADTASDT